MGLLQAGVDCSVIALWLSHETHRDDADLSACLPRTKRDGAGEGEAVRARQMNPVPPERSPARLPGGALSDQTMLNRVGSISSQRPQQRGTELSSQRRDRGNAQRRSA